MRVNGLLSFSTLDEINSQVGILTFKSSEICVISACIFEALDEIGINTVYEGLINKQGSCSQLTTMTESSYQMKIRLFPSSFKAEYLDVIHFEQVLQIINGLIEKYRKINYKKIKPGKIVFIRHEKDVFISYFSFMEQILWDRKTLKVFCNQLLNKEIFV